jgi:hypothetical protein
MPHKRCVKRDTVTQPSTESYRLIPLTRNQNAIVDASDFEWLSQWNWFAVPNYKSKSFYACSEGNRLKMHRLILGCGIGEEGDHKDGNGLNNRRANLRKCLQIQNARNRRKHAKGSSRYKGVSFRKKYSAWRSRIGIGKSIIHLGYFSSEKEAAEAYNEAAKRLHGEFAELNHIY